MNSPGTASDARSDEGFTLVDIIASMFVLAIFAVAFLPLLIQGVRQAAENTTFAAATQVANQQLELAQSEPSTCNAITAFAATAVTAFEDPRGIELETTMSAGACPTTFPGVIELTVAVSRDDTGTVVTEAATLVYVSAAS